MARTFNCGIGMVVITPADKAAEIADVFEESGESVWRIGVIDDQEGVRISNWEQGWTS